VVENNGIWPMDICVFDDLVKLNPKTFAKFPLKSHIVDEIREVFAILLHGFILLI
jgi:hypothetical protein